MNKNKGKGNVTVFKFDQVSDAANHNPFLKIPKSTLAPIHSLNKLERHKSASWIQRGIGWEEGDNTIVAP